MRVNILRKTSVQDTGISRAVEGISCVVRQSTFVLNSRSEVAHLCSKHVASLEASRVSGITF